MHQSFAADYERHMKRNRRRLALKRFIQVMSCIVVFCTTYALILPAITKENETFCGFEEHSHSQACYQQVSPVTLICSLDQLGVHSHNELCYNPEGILICDQADFIIHVHAPECYDINKYLICPIPEHPAHIHDDSCYSHSETDGAVAHQHSDACYFPEKGNLSCILEESEGHTHGTDCYLTGEELMCQIPEHHLHDDNCYEYPLICTESTDPHIHRDGCFTRGECICTETEDHDHMDACFESVIICQLEAGQIHIHDSMCYSAQAQLHCVIEQEHVHCDACYNQILLCETAENPAHLHNDSCYVWEDVLMCGFDEGQTEAVLVCTEADVPVHIHTESCFESKEPESFLICTDLSEEHVHVPECYLLFCGLEPHSHSLSCYSDPEADLETASVWEATFKGLELKGHWPEDVLAIAQTQLGYRESDRNYEVDNDQAIRGYTRYGDWYGIPYGDWCAMFVSFCLDYADVQNMPLHSSVQSWIDELIDARLYHDSGIYEPKPGDLVFFDWEDDLHSDHVGLVAEVIPETVYEPAKLKTIEGNSSNCVQYVYYDLHDNVIIGYSEIPENNELFYCGFASHVHNEYCHDGSGMQICQMQEHSHEDACLTDTFEQQPEEVTEEMPIYYCGSGEHMHTEDCFDLEGVVVCQITEHTHDATCESEPVVNTYFCGTEAHMHTQDCFDAESSLVCLLSEHSHSDVCLQEPVYYCGCAAHTHNENCSDDQGNLTCQTIVHSHSSACETEPVYYCGREEHDHAGACYGNEGAIDCPLKEHQHGTSCTLIPEYHCGQNSHSHENPCYNTDGFLTCETAEHTHTWECEGFSCGMNRHIHNSSCYNESDTLICRILEHEHDSLCSHYICAVPVHIHGHWCYDANGNVACGQTEHSHSAFCLAFILSYSDQNMAVTATITGVEFLPADLSLAVIPITEENAPEQFASMQVAVSEEIASSNQFVSAASFFDLKLISGGEEYFLPAEALVSVTVEFANPGFAPDVLDAASNTMTFLLTPEITADQSELPSENDAEEERSAAAEFLDTIIDYASELLPSASAAGLDDEWSSSGNYQASGIEGTESGGNTSVTFQSNQLPSFGIALTADATFSQYWERVESLGELKAGEQYMIISTEGNYAMLGADSSNAVPVTLTPIAGHRKVYRISLNTADVATTNLLWEFTTNNGYYKIENVGTSKILYPQNNKLFGTGNCTVRYLSVENCFRICEATNNTDTKGNYHLRFHENIGKNFQSSNAANTNSDSDTSDFGITFYNARDMLIFRMLPATASYSVPADYELMANPPVQDNDEDVVLSKPVYGDFLDTSDGKSGTTGIGAVSGRYYSDPATSKLEAHFRKSANALICKTEPHTHVNGCYDKRGRLICGYNYEHSHTDACYGITEEGSTVYAMHELVDGMVRTDKSVIYADDDYDAFSSYVSNTFGITLSALGQAYPISSKYQLTTPVDVVFILDCSGSMSANTVSNGDTRAEAMVDALNGSIKSLMEKHEENRVGVVLYAQGTNELLPLDRYKADNDNYFVTNRSTNNVVVNLTSQKSTIDRVFTSNSLVTESGDTSYRNLGADTYQGFGTYTQAGIAMGSKVFHDIPKEDTTYFVTVTDQGKEQVVPIQRQPVFILLSDGEPTYSTNMYTDVLNAVDYADGNGGNGNVKGIHGYYTILSANHYKRMVGLHYDRPALFYSIALLKADSDDGTSGDYKKAVLDPSAARLANLSDDASKYDGTSEQLLSLLSSSTGVQSIKTYVNWPDDWTHVPHLYEPTMPNPFSNYSYADGSFFENYSTDQLLEHFNSIIDSSLRNSEYGFVLVENTGVTMVDYIGAGMEIKGTPVLRYGGRNYTNPKVVTSTEIVKDSAGRDTEVSVRTLTYAGKFRDPYIPQDDITDLSTITIKITDNYPVEHIYMCNDNSAAHTHTADCGIYYTYLCGHHAHRLSCHEGSKISGKLICDDPHDHVASGCVPISTIQKIEVTIPDTALPVYMPDLVSSNFYYEALPVRLIYQVGLTQEATKAVADLAEYGGALTFYTNRWGGNQHARSDMFPSDTNPFYYDQTYIDPETKEEVNRAHTYEPHEDQKSNNVTGTEEYFVKCHEGSALIQNQQAQHVYHEQGNNGKLEFSVETIDIPVEKVWSEDTPEVDIPEQVEMTLYRVTPDSNGGNPTGRVIQTAVITPDDSGVWSHSFTGVPIPDGNWYYAIAETPVTGFDTTYFHEDLVTFDVTDNSEITLIQAAKVSLAEEGSTAVAQPTTITNQYRWMYELPETGGPGVTLYYALGTILLAVCAVYMIPKNRNKRGKQI